MKLTQEQKDKKNQRDKEIINELDRMITELKAIAEECEMDGDENSTQERQSEIMERLGINVK